MNLAEIRKKAEENRRTATAASVEAADEVFPSAVMDIMAPPPIEELLTAEEVYLPEDVLDELPESAEPVLEDYLSEPVPFPGPAETLPAAEVPAAAGADEEMESSQPAAGVTAAAAKRPARYSPLEIILSGRESAADVDDNALYQSTSYAADDIEEYLCFRVANEEYALSIMAIKEIIKPRDVTEVPRMPSFISGVISLRGVIIPVMDMRLRLSLPRTAVALKERIVVLKMDSGYCGILVDEVVQVARIRKADIEEPPAVLDGIDRDFVTGLGHFDNRMLIILNLETILDIGVH